MAEIGVAENVAAFARHMGFALDAFQIESIEKLEQGRGVLVSAPTSSGKTVVAEYPIWKCLAAPAEMRLPRTRPHRIIYTTPLKALSNQKFRDLSERYGAENVGLVTGENTINDEAAVLVMTTEILRNILYDEPQRVDTVSDIILDEVHYIDDYPRGTVWEEIIIETPQHIRLTGLSATISNIDEVADWMSGLRGQIGVVIRSERPVALEVWLCMDNQLWPLFDQAGHAAQRTVERAQKQELGAETYKYLHRAPDNDLIHVIMRLRQQEMLPAIYFIFSRRGCREAMARCSVHDIDLTSLEEKRELDAAFAERLAALSDEDERIVFADALDAQLLRRGIAMHHAGMLPYAKETVEVLFQRGLIKVVFATETLSLGLNMPARACVISSFTKFDGTGFHTLTASELTQLMGRAGRRGIDAIGHGVILKEHDVDIRDIYDAAIGGEMAVQSKFGPTYNMVLTLLRTRTLVQAEELLAKSFGQFQAVQRNKDWSSRKRNLEDRYRDLQRRVFRHPRVKCTEKTLTTHLHLQEVLERLQSDVRRSKRQHWQDRRSGRYGSRYADPGGRIEMQKRELRSARRKLQDSPCYNCPYFEEHRAHRRESTEISALLQGGEAELREAQGRYRREFRALRAVLQEAGFLDGDTPTELGLLASGLFGESSLILADALVGGWMADLKPPELAATLAMLVGEDRGRERFQQSRRHFPSPGVEQSFRSLRSTWHRLSSLERRHNLNTLPPLAFDQVKATYQWAAGTELSEIELPANSDVGDLIKTVKNVYSLLRQMEQALREHPVRPLVIRTREAVERDLIRRI